jgi:hypothetical protein
VRLLGIWLYMLGICEEYQPVVLKSAFCLYTYNISLEGSPSTTSLEISCQAWKAICQGVPLIKDRIFWDPRGSSEISWNDRISIGKKLIEPGTITVWLLKLDSPIADLGFPLHPLICCFSR